MKEPRLAIENTVSAAMTGGTEAQPALSKWLGEELKKGPGEKGRKCPDTHPPWLRP